MRSTGSTPNAPYCRRSRRCAMRGWPWSRRPRACSSAVSRSWGFPRSLACRLSQVMSRERNQPTLADGTPERLGRYRLVRPLSTGGMAHVFEGRRESLAGVAPRVAIKVILPEYAKDDGFQKLFRNEAVVGSQLHHQNIVQIQDFDFADGRLYLVMEYVDGITLRRV